MKKYIILLVAMIMSSTATVMYFTLFAKSPEDIRREAREAKYKEEQQNVVSDSVPQYETDLYKDIGGKLIDMPSEDKTDETNYEYDDLLSSYLMDEITYDDLIAGTTKLLEKHFYLIPKKFQEVTISQMESKMTSRYRLYIQHDKDRTMSTIFIIEGGRPLNKVKTLFKDGSVYEVSQDENNENNLIIWWQPKGGVPEEHESYQYKN